MSSTEGGRAAWLWRLSSARDEGKGSPAVGAVHSSGGQAGRASWLARVPLLLEKVPKQGTKLVAPALALKLEGMLLLYREVPRLPTGACLLACLLSSHTAGCKE